MNNTFYFNEEKGMRMRFLQEAQKFIPTNEYLKKFDWLFIPPLYMQGFEIGLLNKLMLEENTDPEKITNIFKNKFYDLNWSASFIRGYCSRVTFIEPFLKSIEHSMILAYQADFEGAIKTILPIIEGILRQYLRQYKNFSGRITYTILSNSLDSINDDIILSHKEYLENFKTHNNQLVNFSTQQIDELLNIEKQKYDIWFSFFGEFINQSLYMHSHGNGTNGELNRHDILHVFNAQPFNYSLQNYLKLYTSIYFLVWAFLILEDKNLLNEISDEDFAKTYIAYKRIVVGSKFLLEAKAELDDRYKKQVILPTTIKETVIKFLILKLVKMKN